MLSFLTKFMVPVASSWDWFMCKEDWSLQFFLSSASLCWGFVHSVTHSPFYLTWALGIQIQGLVLPQQALY